MLRRWLHNLTPADTASPLALSLVARSGHALFPPDRPETSVCTSNTDSDALVPHDTPYLAAVSLLPGASKTCSHDSQHRHIGWEQCSPQGSLWVTKSVNACLSHLWFLSPSQFTPLLPLVEQSRLRQQS